MKKAIAAIVAVALTATLSACDDKRSFPYVREKRHPGSTYSLVCALGNAKDKDGKATFKDRIDKVDKVKYDKTAIGDKC